LSLTPVLLFPLVVQNTLTDWVSAKGMKPPGMPVIMHESGLIHKKYCNKDGSLRLVSGEETGEDEPDSRVLVQPYMAEEEDEENVDELQEEKK
jgi:hypothetical protein